MSDLTPNSGEEDFDRGVLLRDLVSRVPPAHIATEAPTAASGQQPDPDKVPRIHIPNAFSWASFILIMGSAALPWIASPSVRAMPSDIPIRFLYEVDAESGGFSILWVVAGLALVILLGSVSPFTEWLRKLAGTAAIAVPGAVMAQWFRYLNDAGLSSRFWGYIGAGCFAIGAGGLLAVLSHART